MKNIGKSVLAGLLTVLAAWVFLSFFPAVFTGLSNSDAYVVGGCFFLAFEIALCTGLVLGKLKERDQ